MQSPKLVELCELDVWGTLCNLLPLISPCAVHFHFPSFNLSTAHICLSSFIHGCGPSASQQWGRNCIFLSSFPRALIPEQKYFFLFQLCCSFSLCMAQTMDMSTSKLCQEWEKLRENRLSRSTLDLSPLTQQTWRRCWINDARQGHEMRSNSDFTPCGKERCLCARVHTQSEGWNPPRVPHPFWSLGPSCWFFPWCCSVLLQCFQNKYHRKQI